MLKSITDYLLPGEQHAKSARELAYSMNCNTRDITQMVQDERRHGAAIRLQAAQTIINTAAKFAQRLKDDENSVAIQQQDNRFNFSGIL